jgi:hypothetical protein
MSELSDQISSDTTGFLMMIMKYLEGTAVPDIDDIPLGKHGRQMELNDVCRYTRIYKNC